MKRTPDQILDDINYLIDNDIVFDLMWEVINDCIDSMELAVNSLVAPYEDKTFTAVEIKELVITVKII